MNLRKVVFICFVCLVAAAASFAQGGGKAEPKRIELATGKTITLAGTLSNGQEMEYIFSAREGQTVTITNSRTSLFDFRVFNEAFDLETEFESSPVLTFTLPGTGDYLFFVRKKQVSSPHTARFSLTLTIK